MKFDVHATEVTLPGMTIVRYGTVLYLGKMSLSVEEGLMVRQCSGRVLLVLYNLCMSYSLSIIAYRKKPARIAVQRIMRWKKHHVYSAPVESARPARQIFCT